ncbi:MAG: dipeptidase [Firmicutes bacterium]|nr:dipeptidase [Bacillota bacterium]
MSEALAERALSLHRRALVADTHADSIMAVVGGERRLIERSDKGHIDFPRLAEGGIDLQVLACFIEAEYKPERALAQALRMIDAIHREVEASGGQVVLALSAGDAERAAEQGKQAVMISLEGGEPIGLDLAVLRSLYRLGVRLVGLTWNQRNAIADGVGELRSRGGLTTFGVELVKEMNRLGMLVDVSHLSEAGFWDVLEVSSQPVIASHSNARALCDHPRNLTDEQIKALAKNGGVIGMNFFRGFVDRQAERATLERVLDHIDHIANLVGPIHVGLGADFDGADPVVGLEDVTRVPAITAGLLQRGYKDEDVLAILGGNHLRLMRQVIG